MGKSRWASLIVAAVAAVILFWLYGFNQHHYVNDEYLITNFAVLFWLPMLLVLAIFREDPTNFGFAAGDTRRGYKTAGILFLLLLPLMIYAATKENYQQYYPMDPAARHSLAALFRFEIMYGVYLFCWEFFFRGFLLFGLSRSIGVWGAVFAQTLPFGIMHYGKPEFAVSFLSGLILGWLAARSKSFMPCFILHWAISITFDVLVLTLGHGFVG